MIMSPSGGIPLYKQIKKFVTVIKIQESMIL